MSRLTVIYDRQSDVMHVRLSDVPYEGYGVASGVELDFALRDGMPCGAKVIGFQRNGWNHHLGDLGRVLGQHLQIAPDEVSLAILSAYQRT